MVNMDFDFGGVKASSGFEPFKGTVRARIEKIEVKNTKPKEGVEQKTSDGKPAQYLNVEYKVAPEQTALSKDENEMDVSGRKVWGIQSIRFPDDPMDDTSDERQTREIFLAWLNVASGSNFEDHQGGIDFQALYGNEVMLVCDIGSYEGKPNQRVSRVKEVSEDGSPLDTLRNRL